MSRTEAEMRPELERAIKAYEETKARAFGETSSHKDPAEGNRVSAIYVSPVFGHKEPGGLSSGGTKGPLKISRQERRSMRPRTRIFVSEDS